MVLSPRWHVLLLGLCCRLLHLQIQLLVPFLLQISLTSATKQKPKALIHIGPHKTGSTHLQLNLRKFVVELERDGYYYPKLNADTGYDVKDAALFGHFLHGNGTGSERVLATTEKMKAFLKQRAESGNNIVMSVENFSTLSTAQVAMLREALLQFDVTVVMAYREWLSRFKSYHSEISYNTDKDTMPVLSTLFEAVSARGLLLNDVVHRFGSAFGWDRIVILDYYGMAAAKKDLVYVVLCEVGKVACAGTSELNKKTMHENPSKSWLPRELLEVFRNHVAANAGCSMPRAGFREALKIFRNNITCSRCIKPPSRKMKLESLYSKSVEFDTKLRSDYGKYMLYQNVAANRDAMRAVTVEELLYWRIYDDPYWKQWMQEQFRSFREQQLVTCQR